MKLFYSPLACSLASRIAAYEAGVTAELIEVDPRTKRTSDGTDFRAVFPLALVPALVFDDGRLLTENAAILQYLADQAPSDRPLAPRDGFARSVLQQWLCFIGTELHKGFTPLLHKESPAEVKAYARDKLVTRLAHVEAHLARQPFLLDTFSVADAYLFAILNWTQVTTIKLTDYPALKAFHARMLERPAVARAFTEERALYLAELQRAS